MTLPLRKTRVPGGDELRPYLEEIDGNQWYSNYGPLVSRLEEKLEAQFGVPPGCVLTVSSATAGLQLCLRNPAYQNQEAGYCAIPGFAFPAVGCVAEASLSPPVICDVEEATWQLQPTSLPSELIPQLDAAMPVSCFGAPLNVSGWSAFAENSGVSVIFDAAWCFGSLIPAKQPSVVSLHASKVLGIGEGGFVLSTDTELIRELRERANFGLGKSRLVERSAGMNAKMSEFAAAVALAALDGWPEREAAAKKLASLYLSRFSDMRKIKILPGFDGSWASAAFAVRMPADCVTRVREALAARSIETRQWWSPQISMNPAFEGIRVADDTDISHTLAAEVLNLPFHEYVTEEHVDIIADTVIGVVHG